VAGMTIVVAMDMHDDEQEYAEHDDDDHEDEDDHDNGPLEVCKPEYTKDFVVQVLTEAE